MSPKNQLMLSVKEAVAASETSLRDTWPGERRAGLIELVRIMDLQGMGSREGQKESQTGPALDWLYANGYPRALQIFVDESTSNPGYPLFRSSGTSQVWAASALQQAGRIELFRRVLGWVQHGLATLRADKDGLVEVLLTAGSGVEAVEREDYAWLSHLTTQMQEPAMNALSERQSYIDRLMMARVHAWRRHFIGYVTTPGYRNL